MLHTGSRKGWGAPQSLTEEKGAPMAESCVNERNRGFSSLRFEKKGGASARAAAIKNEGTLRDRLKKDTGEEL